MKVSINSKVAYTAGKIAGGTAKVGRTAGVYAAGIARDEAAYMMGRVLLVAAGEAVRRRATGTKRTRHTAQVRGTKISLVRTTPAKRNSKGRHRRAA